MDATTLSPIELTWSCYVNEDEPCGYCVGCTGRAKAFTALDIEDSLLVKQANNSASILHQIKKLRLRIA